MHKYNQWFSRKTWEMHPPGYRGWETICPGRGQGKGMVACSSPAQLTGSWNVASWLGVVYLHKQPEQGGAWKTESGMMKKMPQIRIRKYNVLRFKWVCMVIEKWQQDSSCIFFLSWNQLVPNNNGYRNFHDFLYSYMFILLTANQ